MKPQFYCLTIKETGELLKNTKSVNAYFEDKGMYFYFNGRPFYTRLGDAKSQYTLLDEQLKPYIEIREGLVGNPV